MEVRGRTQRCGAIVPGQRIIPGDAGVSAERHERLTPGVGQGRARWTFAVWTATLAALGLSLWSEVHRLEAPGPVAGPASLWWSDPEVDWTPFVPVLLLSVPCWFIRQPLWGRPSWWWWKVRTWGSGGTASVVLGLSVGLVALGMSASAGRKLGNLPPAYHDEYSYLFQAKTFAAGRVSYPSHSQLPELFDQMHVLNEGRFASRYYPGAGLWIAPFLRLGNPWWGHRVAHAASAMLLYAIGLSLHGRSVGIVAGLLLSVSPGVVLFSNLLLAHHPTLLGLLLFLLAFVQVRRRIREGRPAAAWSALAGVGLAYAMLCRPMTAAGVGLPFGVWFAWWLVTGRGASPVHSHTPYETWAGRLRLAVPLAVPLVVALAGILAYHSAITGDPWISPYQLYTETYTPRHVYGFNNVLRGEQNLGPKVLDSYDRWALNLTPKLAARNVWRRLSASWRWTLGFVPLLMTSVVMLLTIAHWSGDWRLLVAAIVSLHAVHVPYWFEGIMGWHYVFESAPLWLLLFAGVTVALGRHFASIRRPGMILWWWALTGTAVVVNLVTVEPFWPGRLDRGLAEVLFPRQRYGQFHAQVEGRVGDSRALVLVVPDPTDRHMDYVVNDPSLDGRVLYGRWRGDTAQLARIRSVFPDRDLWMARPLAMGGSGSYILERLWGVDGGSATAPPSGP
jgi:hypothetical protein